ncbi:hypothetical protein H0A36_06670 [Endozoicomonas sp. SM1973]|uniref:Regulatory signaling modulator protein AmpE n=1 Tax=Spartinivicinus marinus TaxID=2994442 RepID=A0A853HVA6_9GAMM|nr:hypothetical protein [Spartinivicinus marinus]MCX4028355.1 hypothetical protein [Spartinivicinus marinus]NYZ65690.1 hypothetical protein [Spartinivicinus marinus]
MLFISLCIGVAIFFMADSRKFIQHDNWFNKLIELVASKLGGKLGAEWIWVITLLIPTAVVAWLVSEADEAWLGFPMLLISVVLLVYSLGREGYLNSLDLYVASLKVANAETVFIRAQELFPTLSKDLRDEWSHQYQQIRQLVFYQVLEQLFTVVFWFIVLGPVAALIYRMNELYLANQQQNDANKLASAHVAWDFKYIIEWLPARVLAWSFTLAGNFTKAYHECQQSWRRWAEPPGELVVRTGLQALTIPLDMEEFKQTTDTAEQQQMAADELMAVRGLLNRTVVIWGAIIALVTLLT